MSLIQLALTQNGAKTPFWSILKYYFLKWTGFLDFSSKTVDFSSKHVALFIQNRDFSSKTIDFSSKQGALFIQNPDFSSNRFTFHPKSRLFIQIIDFSSTSFCLFELDHHL